MMTPLDPTHELEITRRLDAPIGLVLRMWSEPELIDRWWGVFGTETTTHELHFQPGGTWSYTMVCIDGEPFNMTVYYVETGPDRIIYDQGGQGEKSHFRVTVALESTEDKKTNMVFRMTFRDYETLRVMVDKYGAHRHEECIIRLDEALADHQSFENPFEMYLSLPSPTEIRTVRSLQAPKALVFEAYTNADYIRRWQGPRDLECTECSFDARVGGRWSMSHHRPDTGDTYHFSGEVLEFDRPDRLVSTFQFGDYEPMVNTVTFEEEAGITKVTTHSRYSTTESRDGMLFSGMEHGMKEGYERLEEIFAMEAQGERSS